MQLGLAGVQPTSSFRDQERIGNFESPMLGDECAIAADPRQCCYGVCVLFVLQ